MLRAFLKRLYSITYFNKITFNVSTPHVHFWSQIHTNNSNIEAQSSRYGKTVWINFFFLQQFDHLIKILFTYASVLFFFQKMFLRLFRFIENWSNSLFFNNSLYLLFLINYSKNRSHIFDFSFIHTQHKQHVRIPTIYGHKWVNKIAAVIRHRRRLPDL